jgi:putative flippase GtrA
VISPAHSSPAGRRRNAKLSRIARYCAVSAFCLIVHNGIMIGLDALGFHYVVCQAASATVLLPTGYLLQAWFTFGADRSPRGFLRYSAMLITNFPVALLVLWLLRDRLGLPMVWASPISTVVLICWNYATTLLAFSRLAGAALAPSPLNSSRFAKGPTI